MKKQKLLLLVALVSTLSIMGSGCSSAGRISGQTDTNVQLQGNNYTVIKPGAMGQSYGFRFLGIIPIFEPNYADAKAKLYKNVKEPLAGRAIALANQTEDRSCLYVVLFSIPRVTITADVIEFTSAPNTN